MNFKDAPTIWRIALTDPGVFIVFSISFIIVPLLMLVSFVELWPFKQNDSAEAVQVIKILLSAWGVFFVAGFWWSKVIQKSFKSGKCLQGKIIEFDKPVGPYFAVTYEFIFQGNRIAHRTAFINSQRTKNIAKIGPVTILYNPKSKRSFLYEAFSEVKMGSSVDQ